MEFVKGLVVRSKAGHDKGSFYVVLDLETDAAVVCDGNRRALANPKRKKFIHLSPTNTVIPNHLMKTNREIYEHLQPFRCK
ncbi:MAG: KOW domain-containing RNA-binding protein [Clostridium sp.]|nr:KOW domain-containing RNA-binding protein [Clostridium sp.]MEE0252775.1 KOW domain-containing RNA-binding protein [Acutalibacteraceae bacterium]